MKGVQLYRSQKTNSVIGDKPSFIVNNNNLQNFNQLHTKKNLSNISEFWSSTHHHTSKGKFRSKTNRQ